jgi:hypothetical protein
MGKSATSISTVDPKELTVHKSKYAGVGQDTIDSDDIYMPRLKLGQDMSPEVKDKLVNVGDLFNSVTGEIICPAGEKIPVIIVMHSKEYILWDDRNGGNRGVLARARRVVDGDTVRYRWDKPNQDFEVMVDGKTKVKYHIQEFVDQDGLNKWGTQLPGNAQSPPAAGESQNYILALPTRDYELIALSLSKTAIGVAKKLNTSIKFAKAAIFERVYELGSFIDRRNNDSFANFQFSPSWQPVAEEIADNLSEVFQNLTGRNIVVDDKGDDAQPSDNKGF